MKDLQFRFTDAWSDEAVMINWIQNDWGSYFNNPLIPGSDGKLLITDIHRGQQTLKVKTLLGRLLVKPN